MTLLWIFHTANLQLKWSKDTSKYRGAHTIILSKYIHENAEKFDFIINKKFTYRVYYQTSDDSCSNVIQLYQFSLIKKLKLSKMPKECKISWFSKEICKTSIHNKWKWLNGVTKIFTPKLRHQGRGLLLVEKGTITEEIKSFEKCKKVKGDIQCIKKHRITPRSYCLSSIMLLSLARKMAEIFSICLI